jgi:ABC-type antimicrobial peptide transport system permease subunit
MEKSEKKVSIQLTGILNVIVFFAFFLAKIFDKIDWSWWWVFSPLWIPLALLISILIIIGICYLLILGIDKWM